MRKVFVLVTIICLLCITYVFGEGENRVNLINDKTYLLPQSDVTLEDGILRFLNPTREYLGCFSVPDLTNDFTWVGDVKLIEFGSDKHSNGVRFCIGNDRIGGNYTNIIVSKIGGIAAEQRGTTQVNNIYPYKPDALKRAFEDGSEFHFELVKKSHHILFKIDDVVALDFEFPEEYDLFTEGDDFNLGFFASSCSFEVSNMAVYDDNVIITPVPTATPVRTPSPNVNATNTIKPIATSTTKVVDVKKVDSGVNPLIIILFMIALFFFVFSAVLYLLRRKIKGRKHRLGGT